MNDTIRNPMDLFFVRSFTVLGILFLINNLTAQPSASIYGEKVSNSADFEVYFSFSDSVVDFTTADISVTNGSAISLDGQDRHFSAVIKAASPGNVTTKLPAGAVTEKGGSQKNTVSNSFIVDAQYDVNTITWKVDSDADWKGTGSQGTGLNFANGEAKPTGQTAQYTSAVKTFETKVKPRKILFRQSPVWENWTQESEQVGPGGASDAPIFLSIANDDYYFFGNTTGGYAAWHSTDMQNWVKYRNIGSGENPGPSVHYMIGRWMTSAEYKDGTFYIIGDVPNDEDPHLWIDDDLSDDTPATYYETAVLKDPSHGSDAAVIRSDEDGLFHIIYEDWDPINARKHAWDSPLGGHTSSPDCINGFTHHKHLPVVDHRTTPTGNYATYRHPGNADPCRYQIHEPEQKAFGDWNALKVGSQLYLFSDYDPIGSAGDGDMKVAIHTSTSIYKQFELVDTLGSGHPDPTSGFAEGKFYLITQKADHTSPGPWVEQVEARAGVDVDGNGSIDNWTDWQAVKETYDHKPGYARVVDVKPAELDLSSLPEGKGFKFEFRISDQTANASTPIMDYVEMSFESATPIDKRSGKKGPVFHISNEGEKYILHYRVDKPGLAAFSIYDLEGKLVHILKRSHSIAGNFQLTLDKKTPTWNVIEYTSPEGLKKRSIL